MQVAATNLGRVGCDACDHEGGLGETRREAFEMWNWAATAPNQEKTERL